MRADHRGAMPTKRGGAVVALALTMALATVGGSAAAPAGDEAGGASSAASRQTVTVTLGETRPGRPTTSDFLVRWRNPGDPAAKPYSIRRIITRLPPGSVIETSVPARCTASDAQLIAQGAAACPPASRVGSGRLLTDVGSPDPLQRYTVNTVASFNGDHEVIGLAESQSPPTRVVSRTKIHDNVLTVDLPAFPGFPPPDNYLAFKRLHLHTRAYRRHGEAYARTPPYCPAGERWRIVVVFVYRDDVRQRAVRHAPCDRRAAPGNRGSGRDDRDSGRDDRD